MDSYYIDRSDGDSQQSRSRSNTHLSNATSQFQDLNIKSSVKATAKEGGTSKEDPTSTSSCFDPDQQHPSSTSLLSSSTPQQAAPFPDFSQAELDANWLFTEPEDISAAAGQAPIVRLDPAHQPSEPSQPSISRSNSFPANMRSVQFQPYDRPYYSQDRSAVGVQNYDSRFDAGIQPSYTWPRK
jgi:hypothetical protein